MKAILLLLMVFVLNSCHLLHKSRRSTRNEHVVSGSVVANQAVVSKGFNNTKSEAKIKSEIRSDSGYKKETTIKEFFDSGPVDRKLRYRETTVKETGNLARRVNEEVIQELKERETRYDSTVSRSDSGYHSRMMEMAESRQAHKRKLFPGWVFPGLLLGVLIFICWYKKLSPIRIWQILKKVIK